MPVKPLDRRTFIKGAGISLSLPFLEAMLPLNRSWAAVPSRFAALYMGNGMLCGRNSSEQDFWSSVGNASGITTFSTPLQKMIPYKDYLTVVQNCSFNNLTPSGNAGHEQAAPSFLTGLNVANDLNLIPPTGVDSDVSRLAKPGMSLDRMIANSQPAALKSLMMSVGPATSGFYNTYPRPQVMATVSWDSQTAHLNNETIRNVVDAFRRLISSGLKTTPGTSPSDAVIKAYNQKKSVLDGGLEDINSHMLRLGVNDRPILTQYLDSIRKIETDMQAALASTPPAASCQIPSTTKQNEYLANTLTTYDTVTKVSQSMIEIMALAFQCGITNVSTLMLSYDWSTVPGGQFLAAYGVPNVNIANYHNASHYGSDGIAVGGLDAVKGINIWHIEQLAYLAQVFKALPDANGGNLLDNSAILFGSGMGDPDSHLFTRMVKILLGKGGGLKPTANGKIIDAGGAGNAHPKLLQTIAAGFGITTTVGDSGGATIPGIIT